MVHRPVNRRRFLKFAGVASSTALVAGCLGDDDDIDPGDDTAPADDTDPADDADDDLDFPTEPVTWVVPFGEGGGTDTYARQIQGPMADHLGVSINIDNRPGAGGLVGAGAMFRSAPDGYTFGSVNLPSVVAAWLVQEPDFDIREVEGVGGIGQYPFMMISNPDYEVENLDDLVDRFHDGEFETFAIQGIGHTTHMIAEIMKNDPDFDLQWDRVVVYDGGGPVRSAVIADEVSVGIATATSALPGYEAGDLDVPVNLSSMVTDVFPDVTPAPDEGYPNIDFVALTTLAKFAPPGTDRDVIDALSGAIEAAVNSDDVQQWSEDTGNAVGYLDPDETSDALVQAIESIEENVDLDEIRAADV